MVLWLSGYRLKSKFFHIVVNCMRTQKDAFVCKKLLHHPVSRFATGIMIDRFDCVQDESFLGLFGALAVLSVIVVSIGTNIQTIKKPCGPKPF